MGIQMRIAQEFDVDYEAVDLDYVGLNHLAWVRKVWVNGQDLSDRVIGHQSKDAGQYSGTVYPSGSSWTL